MPILGDCKGKKCGEPCTRQDLHLDGICDNHENCVDVLTNPCAYHGCDGKKCGDMCLRDGDIMGFCDKDLYCDYNKKPCGIWILTKLNHLMNLWFNSKSDTRKSYFYSS